MNMFDPHSNADSPSSATQKASLTLLKSEGGSPETLSSSALSQFDRPMTFEDIGIARPLLLDLLLKHILEQQVATLENLVQLLCIPGKLVQDLLAEAKQLMWIENRASTSQARFSLSGSGKQRAEHLLHQSGYAGRVPVPLAQYKQCVIQQSHRHTSVTHSLLQQKLAGESFESEAIEAMGMALNSVKPVLLYGLPGSGKSYLCRQLVKVFDDTIFQPYSIEVNNQIIQLYDPQAHQLVSSSPENNIDNRYQRIERPLIVTGGELTLDMLEVNYDNIRHLYKAPLQMKANNGVLLLDDLGRQQIPPSALFNRWIIPLEERKDYLSLNSGVHFEVPFELVMLFSTNLNPADLADDAFLRRLGYKIQMHPLKNHQYRSLWNKVCEMHGLHCTPEVFEDFVNKYHLHVNKPFLPCYPNDLLSIVKDATRFCDLPPEVTPELLDDAWRHYFVNAV